MQSTSGIFCISLDFEKYWGVRDVVSPEKIAENFLKIESVVLKMLDKFQANDIHATWAFVGMLAHESVEAAIENSKDFQNPYEHKNLSPFPLQSAELNKIPAGILFAQNELQRIISCPGQELGSHTYSHYYCLEDGHSTNHFAKDTKMMAKIFVDLKTTPKSIVFPRNQIDPSSLEIVQQSGMIAFRGNQENMDWANSTFGAETLARRSRRWTDAYFAISRTKWRKISELERIKGLVNIPANRFFRPVGGNAMLEKRKIKRIKNEMTEAATNGYVYHLWWHPHNFTSNIELSLNQLEEILSHFKSLRESHGFQSMNMSEIASNA